MKFDVLSSYILRGVSIFFRFFLVPIYIKYIGISGYGLIGFYSSINAVMVFFDFGMGVASNKILAEEIENVSERTKRIIKTVEVIYWACALVLGLTIIIFARPIADIWLKINDNSIDGIKVVRLMGVLFIVQWPKSLYVGFMTGQKKIRLLNLIRIGALVLQNALLIIIITQWNHSLNTYFYILIGTGVIATGFLRFFGTRSLYLTNEYANRKELKSFFRFCSGVTVFAILSLVIYQFDKLYISRFLSISSLGLYSLAGVIPFAILALIYPITTASFPRIVNIKNSLKAKNYFIEWSTVIFLISGSIFAIVAFNLNQIYYFWLKQYDPYLNMLSLSLLIGVCLHSGTNMIVNVLLANGKSKAVSGVYLASVSVYLFFIVLSRRNTLNMLAEAWVVLNICLLLFSLAALFIFEKKLGFEYCKRLLMVILQISFFVVLMVFSEHYQLYDSHTYYKLIAYFVVFGVNLIITIYYMLKNKMIG